FRTHVSRVPRFLSYSRSYNLPDLHSFPTRRSSDLLRVGPGEQRGPIAHMNPNQGYTVIGWSNDPEGNPWWQLDTGAQKTWVAQSDRKSTRLNSSHVKISYAVFCLKKKKRLADRQSS